MRRIRTFGEIALGAGAALVVGACAGPAGPSSEARGGSVDSRGDRSAGAEHRPDAEPAAGGAAGVAEPGGARARFASAGEGEGGGDGPDGYAEMEAAGVLVFDGSHTLGLVDPDRTVFVPISIGGTEALSISLRLEEESFERPLTHDLLDAVLAEFGGDVDRVQIDEIRRGTFHASVFLREDGETVELDARSSDAVAIAIGHDASIYVHESVIEASGVDRDELEERTPPGERPPLRPDDDDEDDDTIEA